MHGRPALVVSLIAALVLAGCTGSSPQSQPSADVIVPTGTIDPGENATTGTVEGYVLDQYTTPVPGAIVLLTGTAHVTQADNVGHFLLAGVAPGKYVISASKANHTLEAEKSVEVARGLFTRVNLTLLTAVSDAGMRPHTHDWWAEEKEIVIMDRDVDLDGHPACAGGVVLKACTLPLGTEFVLRFKSPDEPTSRPNIVFQGTEKMKVDVTLGATVGSIEVYAKRPSEASLVKVVKADGGTDSGTIDVKAPDQEGEGGDWDPSHTRTSLWYLELYSPDAAVIAEPHATSGPIHIKVTVVRGDAPIPLEKAHPDTWVGITHEKIMDKTCNYIFVPTDQAYVTQMAQPECPGGPDMPSDKSIRPLTGTVRVTLEYENDVPVPVEFGLLYRSADATSWKEVATPTTKKDPATPGGKAERTFDLELSPVQWDSPYAGSKEKPSKWGFFVFISGPIPPSEQTSHRNSVFSGDVRFVVEAWKEGTKPTA